MHEFNIAVTADDFGLSEKINQGIIQSVETGFVKSISLIINAPQTESGISSLKNLTVEVGLHLCLVEGYCLSGIDGLKDREKYFPEEACLHRNWKAFLKAFYFGKISASDIEVELRKQIEKFLSFYPSIPFINVSQHLQVLPVVRVILKKIMKDYDIPLIRLPREFFSLTNPGRAILWLLSEMAHSDFKNQSNDYCIGISETGEHRYKSIRSAILRLKSKKIEIILHPGLNDENLRKVLSQNYRTFDWEGELKLSTILLPNLFKELNLTSKPFSSFGCGGRST